MMAAPSAFPTSSRRPASPLYPSASTTRTRAIQAPIPSRRTRRSRAARRASGDRHVLVVQSGTCKLYEMFAAIHRGSGWRAGSGAVWNLQLERAASARLDLGRRGRAADPAGPGALRRGGRRRDQSRDPLHRQPHAARLHLASAPSGVVASPIPARRRWVCGCGSRRTWTSRASRQRIAVILTALKRYGMIVADNGSNWFLSGAPDDRWSNDDLHALGAIPGSDSRS